MGYNFWYKMVIDKKNKDILLNYMNANGYLNDTSRYTAKFEFDAIIDEYLHSYKSDSEIQKQREIDNKARIGCIFFEEYINDNTPDMVAFSYMAATQYMSSLFKDSESVYKWFIELSNAANSLLTYIDYEHFGYRIIFHRGKEVNIDINYDGIKHDYSNIPKFNEIMEDFEHLMKIYFSGQ